MPHNLSKNRTFTLFFYFNSFFFRSNPIQRRTTFIILLDSIFRLSISESSILLTSVKKDLYFGSNSCIMNIDCYRRVFFLSFLSFIKYYILFYITLHNVFYITYNYYIIYIYYYYYIQLHYILLHYICISLLRLYTTIRLRPTNYLK